MKKTYINGLGCISAQRTFDTVFSETWELNENTTVLQVQKPDYKDFISPGAGRRMAKGVKNAIVASAMAIKEAQAETIDAIITGTGMGCIDDSEKFLKSILDHHEEFLTPTSFIQSTHNTVGGQIALKLKSNAYNFTYVNGAVSFESALLDAKMQIEEQEATSILLGGIDETADYTLALLKLTGMIKKENEAPYRILGSTTPGVVWGEGATFFVIGATKEVTTYAEVLDVEILNTLEAHEVEIKIITFLKANQLDVSDLDAVILGYNGDVPFDGYYETLSKNCFAHTPQVYYKHLSGEYHTASAFGCWVGAKIIKTQQVPELLKINHLERAAYNKILLYNQYQGIDHSFILLSRC